MGLTFFLGGGGAVEGEKEDLAVNPDS